MRRGAGFIVAVLALAGCKSTSDPKPPDREPLGTSSARSKTRDTRDAKEGKGPTWLDPVAKLPGTGTGVPTAGTWSGDPKSPNFNAKLEAQDAVGGKVVDSYNRPAKNIFIRVEAVNDPPGSAAKGIYTDGGGYFFTRGLKPDTTYNLTAEATQEGKQLVGSVQTRVPNPVLTIVLREDLGLPPIGTPDTRPPLGVSRGFPPPPLPTDDTHIPPMGLAPASSNTPRPRDDGAYSPDGVRTLPAPAAIGGGSPTVPKPPPIIPGGSLPAPDDLASPTSKPIRPENVADGPKPTWQPPPTSIPGPPAPVYPVPPPAPAPPEPKPTRPRSGAGFTLYDSQERIWEFPTDKSGSLVLIEFVTTSCVHCKHALPILKDLQSRYAASGLQVLTVLCDEVPLKARAAAAAKYAQDNNVNYAVFVEPGATSGSVRDRLGVESYPTAVLLDSNGAILWRDHPGKKKELETAIQKGLKR